MLSHAYRKLRHRREDVRDYVRAGGRYLGFCLGGYLAGATPGFGLLPGDTDRYITSPGATVHHEKDTLVRVSWRDTPRTLFFQDGPHFILDQGAEATILATCPNGTIAALTTSFGRGHVGVVGPHPEATGDWYTDTGLPVQQTRDIALGFTNSVMTRRTFTAGRGTPPTPPS